MEMRLGPAASARSLPCPPISGRAPGGAESEGSAAVAAAPEGGARSPAPREEPPAGEGAAVRAQTPGSSGSRLGVLIARTPGTGEGPDA